VATPSIPALADRLAADVFRKSYREYLEIKPTHYRWSHLAPQGVEDLRKAEEGHWSDEKLADYLHCDAEEAAACRKRYLMSKKINAAEDSAERLRRAVYEWIGDVTEVDDSTRKRLAGELARMVGNQLFVAAQANEDFMELSRSLAEADPAAPGKPGSAQEGGEPAKWGPQWKD
jgi:Lon protease-like protein